MRARHNAELMYALHQEKEYAGSLVLGLNDALVEIIGILAGLTFAFPDTKLIAMGGLISGFVAALSMGSSEYLSEKSVKGKHPLKAGFYSGIAYLIAATLLVLPYFLLKSPYSSLGFSLALTFLIILFFTYTLSLATKISFKKKFVEMVSISLIVSAISFAVGFLLRKYTGV